MSGSRTRDWDGAAYDRISTPQEQWATVTLDRLELQGDESVLDAGCGSGRVTRMLLDRLPRGRVLAVDAAPTMVQQARENLDDRATVWQSDLVELEVPEPVDAVFSNAVFHWVPDHETLFARLHAALRAGGQMVVQCGGKGNIERFHELAREVASQAPYEEYLGGWEGPWNFATAEETAERLGAAGFHDVQTWLEESPMVPPEPETYLRVVCLGHHLEALPEELREPYTRDVLERCGDPVELDYVRLNIVARA
ncbi:MAG TPA: methyltransferase domain-containing protein [Thermoleophilaceae bacterium]|nr:methyltransferase domain-containing protein [Thermoleophilaceae bacterium]